MTKGTGDDGQEQSLNDAEDIVHLKLGNRGTSDSEASEASSKVATEGEDGAGEAVDKEVPASQETIRDKLEKAGIRTTGNSCHC